ncbi:MAG: hypothetical protein OEZ58_22770, partial [Gammaproteobacteria bacterium]|nr:hypothetical protein [Gammaproteobacteria bacterium]
FNEVMQSNALMQEQITQLKKQINQLVAHSEEAQVFEKASVSQAKTLAQTELQQKQNADKLFKEEQQAAEQQMQQQIQLLDDALAAEAYDPDWSLSAQSELNTAFLAENMASIHLNNVECKATICKLDITPPSDQALEDSFRRISSLKWPGSGFIYMDNASGNVTLYLAKEGHSIPQVN